jgi:hypothetical protein
VAGVFTDNNAISYANVDELLVYYPDISVGFQRPHTEVNQVELKEARITYASITVKFNLKKKCFLNKKREKNPF